MFLLSTPHGDRYVIHDNGDIERMDLAGFLPSGSWKMLGLQHVKRNMLIRLEHLAERLPELELLYKNGNPQYTVRDLDHGTTRVWGNSNAHGVKTIRVIDRDYLRGMRRNRDRRS